MIESIEREGTKVVIRINTGLNIEKLVLYFEWNCSYEYVAELLKYQLCNQFKELKKQIAKQTAKHPLIYLTREEVSELKSTLVHEWNGSKHCRK